MELDTNTHVQMLGTTAQKHQLWQTDEDANAQHSQHNFKGRGSRQIPPKHSAELLCGHRKVHKLRNLHKA